MVSWEAQERGNKGQPRARGWLAWRAQVTYVSSVPNLIYLMVCGSCRSPFRNRRHYDLRNPAAATSCLASSIQGIFNHVMPCKATKQHYNIGLDTITLWHELRTM